MTRDEYRAQKAAKERMRRTEQKHKQINEKIKNYLTFQKKCGILFVD